MRYNDKEKIIKHYDKVSPYYHDLWGEHLHHGYWVTGEETKEEAQLALTKHLAELAGIKHGDKVLDVGCGFGASSIYLAKEYEPDATGITISPVQVDIAREKAQQTDANCKFLLMDADHIELEEKFDVVWSIESISHYSDVPGFLKKASTLLKPGGTVAIIDWFKEDGLSEEEYFKQIEPIEKGMMVELHTMKEYMDTLRGSGLEIIKNENLNKHCAKTWDISLEIIENKKFWLLALLHGREFVQFLESFKSMRGGFGSGNFVYGLIVAKKQ